MRVKKKVKPMHDRKISATAKFQNLRQKGDFRVSRKSSCELRSPILVKIEVASILCLSSVKGRHRKTANVFDIFKASVSLIIERVCYAITNLLGPV